MVKKRQINREQVMDEIRFWMDTLVTKIDRNDTPVVVSFDGGVGEGNMASFEHRGHEWLRDCRIVFDVDGILHCINERGGGIAEMRRFVASVVAHELAHFQINPYIAILGLDSNVTDGIHEMVSCAVQKIVEGVVDGLCKPKKTKRENAVADSVASQNIRTEREAKGSNRKTRRKET